MARFLSLALALVTACASGAEQATSIPSTHPAHTTSPITESTVAPEWDTSSPFAGFSLSPLSSDEAGVVDFFETAASYGDLVAWVGPWQEIDQGGTFVYELSFEHGYVPVVVTGLATDAEGQRIIPEDSAEMVDSIARWVGHHPVPYLGVGVEIDVFLWEESREDFEWFVGAFQLVVAAVHQASPDTKVFPTFQLERLRGLRGGIYGESDTEPLWELVERFPDADVIGFTTYPGLVFSNPMDIPGDYYAEIFEHTDKPIVFTQVGWHAGGEFGDWSGSPEDQADFMAYRVSEMAVLGDMLIWSSLWDSGLEPGAFSTMGLIDREDRARPAWRLWQITLG